MAKTIMVEATYPRDADTVFRSALDLSEMKKAMAQIARYDGLPDQRVAEGDRYVVDVTFFGLMKVRGHVMEVVRLDPAKRLLQSREHSPSVSRWDLRLTVEENGEGALWRDWIEVEAGWKTPLVARFCSYVYSHRHKARRAQSVTAAITDS
ncbi:SRPBCC family protein [Jannaschia pohangensis]|uniref:Polyketide cyclase / dehydrase and lipid transport n=1 Tax=Jannaschia pohangensis TaxID=390807 RepID=A0A1I3JHN4_9RHOB|nr:SRPBCC family protein [Jannaschia pohangensis]SFI59488.1 hypothetical protein SAMN04488095_1321 [Jannaschia pohangensis]